jgi:hypothetical protein
MYMSNKPPVQNTTVPSDNWFQVPASKHFSYNCHTDVLYSEGAAIVEATPSSALLVLLIHALGSYICYITGMFSFIRCVQTRYNKIRMDLQISFLSSYYFPRNYKWGKSAIFVNYFPGNIFLKKLTENWLFLRLFPSFSQLFKANHETPLNLYVRLTVHHEFDV